MAGLWLEVVMIFVLVLINALMALAEFAIVSARKSRLQNLAEQGDSKARVALELATNPGDFLSTVQIGITLVGVLAGAFGGAAISGVLTDALRGIPRLEPYASSLAFATVVAAITLLSVVIGELVPKRIALNRPENYALALAKPMRLLSQLGRPLVRILSNLTNIVLRLLRVTASAEIPPTEEEIKVLLGKATQAGVFEDVEYEMVEGVFRLGDRRVGMVIVPRTEIEWIDLDDSQAHILEQILNSSRSVFPVGQGSLDEIRGTIEARSVLAGKLETGELNISRFLQAPMLVPEHMSALNALEIMRDATAPMLFVIDEFGGVQGLVTINDLLGSVVGDLRLINEPADQSIFYREDGSLLIDGIYPIDQFIELFNLAELPGYDQGLFNTLGGFVMNWLGRIPVPGDRFETNDLRFEVVDMDGLRVDKVLVLRAPTE